MMGTIESTLSALALIDSEPLTLTLDAAIYPLGAIEAAMPAMQRNCEVRLRQHQNGTVLVLSARDPLASRVQIGGALSELLRHSLHTRS